jgi:DNA-binding XRE family transcriptional regulator
MIESELAMSAEMQAIVESAVDRQMQKIEQQRQQLLDMHACYQKGVFTAQLFRVVRENLDITQDRLAYLSCASRTSMRQIELGECTNPNIIGRCIAAMIEVGKQGMGKV